MGKNLVYFLIVLFLFSLTGCRGDKATGAAILAHENNIDSSDDINGLQGKIESLEQEVIFLVSEVNKLKNKDSTLEQCEVNLTGCDKDFVAFHELESKDYKGYLKIFRPSPDEYPGAQFCCNIHEGKKGDTCFKIFLKPDCVKIKIHGDDIDQENWVK